MMTQFIDSIILFVCKSATLSSNISYRTGRRVPPMPPRINSEAASEGAGENEELNSEEENFEVALQSFRPSGLVSARKPRPPQVLRGVVTHVLLLNLSLTFRFI